MLIQKLKRFSKKIFGKEKKEVTVRFRSYKSGQEKEVHLVSSNMTDMEIIEKFLRPHFTYYLEGITTKQCMTYVTAITVEDRLIYTPKKEFEGNVYSEFYFTVRGKLIKSSLGQLWMRVTEGNDFVKRGSVIGLLPHMVKASTE